MAGSLNKVMLIGNLGSDPEMREMGDGTKMAKFSIATTETYKNKQGEKVSNTDWHNIVLWRGIAQVAEKYLKKGDSVLIEGKIKNRSWEDENGVKKYATDIQGDNMTMLGSKRDSDNSQSNQSIETPRPSLDSGTRLSGSETTEQSETNNDLPF
jgi:single-strand DNA-binding protein